AVGGAEPAAHARARHAEPDRTGGEVDRRRGGRGLRLREPAPEHARRGLGVRDEGRLLRRQQVSRGRRSRDVRAELSAVGGAEPAAHVRAHSRPDVSADRRADVAAVRETVPSPRCVVSARRPRQVVPQGLRRVRRHGLRARQGLRRHAGIGGAQLRLEQRVLRRLAGALLRHHLDHQVSLLQGETKSQSKLTELTETSELILYTSREKKWWPKAFDVPGASGCEFSTNYQYVPSVLPYLYISSTSCCDAWPDLCAESKYATTSTTTTSTAVWTPKKWYPRRYVDGDWGCAYDRDWRQYEVPTSELFISMGQCCKHTEDCVVN
ncbi:hypothetical protein THAOC_15468, partial [Thalassiosira oceanica]